jgi:nitroimidazol reductase NimA-like FMN-containing flavoprotein (pyridoxamine 5'-phosphate oxidase superfamily)
MPRNPLLNKTTATRENALTERERDEFLAIKQDCHFASDRGDGWWHLTPLWYVWDGSRFFHTLGASRRHLKNMRRNPNVTICVDVDPRLTEGLAAGTRSVVCFGVAKLTELEEDEELVRQITDRVMERYIGPDRALYSDAVWAEPRTIATVTPQSWLTWDQTKG